MKTNLPLPTDPNAMQNSDNLINITNEHEKKIANLKHASYYDVPENDEIKIEQDFEERDIAKLKNLDITNILHILAGESKEFKNNRVHINSDIACDGDLVFRNCEIVYNVNLESQGKIFLNKNSTLLIENCKITCDGSSKHFLICDEGATDVTITHSILDHCSNFFEQDSYSSICNVSVRNCKLLNPSENILSLKSFESCEISHCYIGINNPNISTISRLGSVFFYNDLFCKSSTSIIVKEVLAEANFDIPSDQRQFNLTLFKLSGAQYSNCTFKGAGKVIQSASIISDCAFENCFNAIDNVSTITHCNFLECERAISEAIYVNHCQFLNCLNNIIDAVAIEIEFCEFYNCVAFSKNSIISCKVFNNFLKSHVKRCAFQGIHLEQGFLIEGSVYKKVKKQKIFVEDCSFKNCVTQRKSGKIIKEYDTYYGLFGNEKEILITRIDRNCRGLDLEAV